MKAQEDYKELYNIAVLASWLLQPHTKRTIRPERLIKKMPKREEILKTERNEDNIETLKERCKKAGIEPPRWEVN